MGNLFPLGDLEADIRQNQHRQQQSSHQHCFSLLPVVAQVREKQRYGAQHHHHLPGTVGVKCHSRHDQRRVQAFGIRCAVAQVKVQESAVKRCHQAGFKGCP